MIGLASLRPTELSVIGRFNCTSRFTWSKFYLKNLHSSVIEKDPNPTVICYEHSELFSFGFWIPRSGFRITCQWNLDSEFLKRNSWFHNPGFRNSTSGKKFPGFRNVDYRTWDETISFLESNFTYIGYSTEAKRLWKYRLVGYGDRSTHRFINCTETKINILHVEFYVWWRYYSSDFEGNRASLQRKPPVHKG